MMDIVTIPPQERIKADVEHIKDWLSKEPHLAHIAEAEDEEWLETFLYNNKFSLEKTKYKLENLYSLRSKHPEIFKDRDPTGEDLRQLKKNLKLVIGHKLTQDGLQVIHVKVMGDPRELNATAFVKMTVMISDILLLDKKNRLMKYINIIDYKDFRPGHILKMMAASGTAAEIMTKAYPIRPKVLHFINIPTYAYKFIETVAKFFPGKLNERLTIHDSTKNTLFEEVEEATVCYDFGGKGPSMDELQELIQKKLDQAREWFENRGTLCSNEELRPKDSKQPEEMRGSFRKLEVD